MDNFIQLLKLLSPENWLLIISLLGNFLFCVFKFKGTKFEKDYKRAVKNAVAGDYYLLLRGKYYLIDECRFITKNSISTEEFQLNKG